MTETLFQLVPVYGLYVVAISTFLSCLAVPIPSSLIMLTAGAFVAAGDLPGPLTAGLALLGALLGDQVGFALGHSGANWFAYVSGKTAAMIEKARAMTLRYGGWAVFLSRWMFSPLGPYMNLVTGFSRMNWWRFTFWGSLGEAVWVAIYLGTGFFFAGQIMAIADIARNVSGALAAGVVTVGLGLWLRSVLNAERKNAGSASQEGN